MSLDILLECCIFPKIISIKLSQTGWHTISKKVSKGLGLRPCDTMTRIVCTKKGIYRFILRAIVCFIGSQNTLYVRCHHLDGALYSPAQHGYRQDKQTWRRVNLTQKVNPEQERDLTGQKEKLVPKNKNT